MIKLNKVIFLLIITLISCKKEDKEQLIVDKKIEMIKVNPIGYKEMKPREILSENVEYIPLETTTISTIGKIDRIQIFEGNYFITDKRNAKGIYIFNSKGNFINKISPFGKGPHEITFMDDILYNKITKQIEIFDSARKKILVYDVNGEFIKEFDTKVYLNSFYPIAENERYYYTGFRSFKGMLDIDKNYRLLKMNEEADLLNSFFRYSDSQANQKIVELQNNFFPIDNSDKVFFLEPYSNNVYELKRDSVILKYKLNFTNANIPDDLLESDENGKQGLKKHDFVLKQSGALLNNILFEDTEELIFWYIKDVYRELHYNKKNKEYYEFSSYFVTDDNIYLPMNHYVAKEFSLSIIEPMNLLNGKINYSRRIQKILEGKKSTDNPIIVKIKR